MSQTFFTELRNALNGKHANISITVQTDGTITCTTLIKGAVNNPQLIGPAEELDRELFNELTKAMQENNIKKLTVNSVSYTEEEEDDEETKPTPKGGKKTKVSKKDLGSAALNAAKEPIESGAIPKEPIEPTEESLRTKYKKTGTPVLEKKLEQPDLDTLDKKVIEEVLAGRTDRTPPPAPKHPEEVLKEVRRKINFAKMKATATVNGNTEMLKATTDIEEQGILQTELDEAQKTVEKCDDCFKRIDAGTYGIAADNTLVNKEALITNPLEY